MYTNSVTYTNSVLTIDIFPVFIFQNSSIQIFRFSLHFWLLKSQDSDNSRSDEAEYNDAGWCGCGTWRPGGDVVSKPGVAEVDAVILAPDTDPGHSLALHSGWERELQVLTGVAAQGRLRPGRILNPHSLTAGTLWSSSSPNIEEGIWSLPSVTAIVQYAI